MDSNGLISMDMLQQIATLHWASTGDSQMASNMAAMKLVGDVWGKLSGQSDLDAIRNETILKISKYVKDNPGASKEQLSKEIGKEIEAFAKKIQSC